MSRDSGLRRGIYTLTGLNCDGEWSALLPVDIASGEAFQNSKAS